MSVSAEGNKALERSATFWKRVIRKSQPEAFYVVFSVFMKSAKQTPHLLTKKELSICIVLPSAGHHNAAQTLTVRSSVCSDEGDLAAKQDSVRSVWMWKQQSSMCQMRVSQRSLEAELTREELLTISESCLMSPLEHVMILLVDCCSKCLQRNVGQMDCWTALTERQQLNWLFSCSQSGWKKFQSKLNTKNHEERQKTSQIFPKNSSSVLLLYLSFSLPNFPFFSSFIHLPISGIQRHIWMHFWVQLSHCTNVHLILNTRISEIITFNIWCKHLPFHNIRTLEEVNDLVNGSTQCTKTFKCGRALNGMTNPVQPLSWPCDLCLHCNCWVCSSIGHWHLTYKWPRMDARPGCQEQHHHHHTIRTWHQRALLLLTLGAPSQQSCILWVGQNWKDWRRWQRVVCEDDLMDTCANAPALLARGFSPQHIFVVLNK